MSIALVLNTSVAASVGTTPPPEVTKMTERIKAMDGCEHIYSLGNAAGGPGLAILIWRDKAAMEAAGAQMATDTSALGGMGLTVTDNAVYDTIAEL
jgi:hypothetical protein